MAWMWAGIERQRWGSARSGNAGDFLVRRTLPRSGGAFRACASDSGVGGLDSRRDRSRGARSQPEGWGAADSDLSGFGFGYNAGESFGGSGATVGVGNDGSGEAEGIRVARELVERVSEIQPGR